MRGIRAKLSATHETRKEEEAVSKRNMDLIARQTKGLKVELSEARADAAEKSRQLVRHRKEVSSDTCISCTWRQGVLACWVLQALCSIATRSVGCIYSAVSHFIRPRYA